MLERIRGTLVPILGVTLCVFTLLEANNIGRLLDLNWYPQLEETSQRAIFAMLGVILPASRSRTCRQPFRNRDQGRGGG